MTPATSRCRPPQLGELGPNLVQLAFGPLGSGPQLGPGLFQDAGPAVEHLAQFFSLTSSVGSDSFELGSLGSGRFGQLMGSRLSYPCSIGSGAVGLGFRCGGYLLLALGLGEGKIASLPCFGNGLVTSGFGLSDRSVPLGGCGLDSLGSVGSNAF